MARVIALLEVDDDLIENGEFHTEMGWVEESGIHLVEWFPSENADEMFDELAEGDYV